MKIFYIQRGFEPENDKSNIAAKLRRLGHEVVVFESLAGVIRFLENANLQAKLDVDAIFVSPLAMLQELDHSAEETALLRSYICNDMLVRGDAYKVIAMVLNGRLPEQVAESVSWPARKPKIYIPMRDGLKSLIGVEDPDYTYCLETPEGLEMALRNLEVART